MNIIVLFYNILFEFVQKFVPSVNKLWFGMPDAKNFAGCCPSTSVFDANFCPRSIFLHQTCAVGFVRYLCQYTGCILE